MDALELFAEGMLLRNSTDPDSPGDEAQLGWLSVLLASLLIFINVALSIRLSLGLTSRLVIAGVRCVLQLSVLGVILEPIFNFGSKDDPTKTGESVWWLVLPYTCLMLTVAAVEATSRPSSAYRWMLTHSLASMGGAVVCVMTYMLLAVVHLKPWWTAQYFIPIVGMLLGNATNGVSLGLSTIINSLTQQTRQVEVMLALGATRWEATKHFVHHAIITAMTPTLNQMSVVGVVSIPGMMTGQILGGQSPLQAARYQIVIFFAILATSTLGCVSSVYLATSQLVDRSHRFRPDRLHSRSRTTSNMFEWMLLKITKAAGLVRAYWIRFSGRCLCCGPRGHRYGANVGWRARFQLPSHAHGASDSQVRPTEHSMDIMSAQGDEDQDTAFYSEHETITDYSETEYGDARLSPANTRGVSSASLTLPLLVDNNGLGEQDNPQGPSSDRPQPGR
eukprot:CAMPEP_0117683358 /NCGR_PEP_ID=MMETSP0804-20121206/20342_1 /TAXON_ID=1074897 /ORGANISM="Tetraselmis astigmatica, Strain CCMP880" /LENGTH=447 /DNA_ID=CAMNT_0005493915 /DNA_START=213 /DNA_END=1556 /DNA_ORIENTATION=+